MGETDDFEWDDRKNEATLAKRDLGLFAAARLFDGRLRVERVSRKAHPGEVRFETMAEAEGRVLICVLDVARREAPDNLLAGCSPE